MAIKKAPQVINLQGLFIILVIPLGFQKLHPIALLFLYSIDY
jgi:hypothetical protein